MHLFDPERPISHRPLLLNGRDIAPIIYVFPSAEGGFELSVMLRASEADKAYYWGECIVDSPEALAAFFKNYRDDPEVTLAKCFDWVSHGRVPVPIPEREEPIDPDAVSGLDLI